MKIIKLTNKNLDSIFNIEKNCFSHPISLKNLNENLNNDKYLLYEFSELLFSDVVS